MNKKRWFSCLLSFLLLLGIVSTSTLLLPAPKARASTADPVQAWIQNTAIPFRTAEPGGPDDDLTSLRQIVGSTPIVGLGEATHGTHEFFAMKARVVEYLVSHMGFTTIAMKNDWAASQLLNSYITSGQGNIWQTMYFGLFKAWKTQEYKDLFEWLRTYNADANHPIKVQFVGFDCQGIGQTTIDTVLNYLHEVDPTAVNHVQSLYTGIIPAGWTYAYGEQENAQSLQQQAQQVYALLHANQTTYLKHSSQKAFDLALQNARLVAQFTTLSTMAQFSDNWVIQRDAFMAENLAWIHDHLAGNHPRIVALAHDVHIANITNYGDQQANFGGFLRKWYGADYLSIGMSFYQGNFLTYDQSYQGQITPLGPVFSTSFNQTLGNANIPRFILDLRHAPAGPVTDWLQRPTIFQMYGLGGEDLSHGDSLNTEFDVLIHFQQTTPAHSIADQITLYTNILDYLWLIILTVIVLCALVASLTWLLVRRRRRKTMVSGSGTKKQIVI